MPIKKLYLKSRERFTLYFNRFPKLRNLNKLKDFSPTFFRYSLFLTAKEIC